MITINDIEKFIHSIGYEKRIDTNDGLSIIYNKDNIELHIIVWIKGLLYFKLIVNGEQLMYNYTGNQTRINELYNYIKLQQRSVTIKTILNG